MFNVWLIFCWPSIWTSSFDLQIPTSYICSYCTCDTWLLWWAGITFTIFTIIVYRVSTLTFISSSWWKHKHVPRQHTHNDFKTTTWTSPSSGKHKYQYKSLCVNPSNSCRAISFSTTAEYVKINHQTQQHLHLYEYTVLTYINPGIDGSVWTYNKELLNADFLL